MFEGRAISALADLNLAQARFLAAAGWVTDEINGDEATAIEIFAADVELGTALAHLDWLREASISTRTKLVW